LPELIGLRLIGRKRKRDEVLVHFMRTSSVRLIVVHFSIRNEIDGNSMLDQNTASGDGL
jgi:hypothetical protein